MQGKVSIGLLLLLMSFFVVAFADNEIPLLGEDSRGNLNREYEIGSAFYKSLQVRGLIESDPMVSRYLSDIGDTLLSGLDRRIRQYHFFIVRDNSINAFALPGGYIGVNAGLINLAKSEGQLASVLAHEIAHVAQMHGMQMLEKSEDLSLKSALSVLAAIVLSTQSVEAGSAVLYAGMASNAQSAVNFTRANEYEADRLGVELLQRAGYNATSMVEFFKLMSAGVTGGVLDDIEYIRTHPVSANRIAEIASRIRSNKGKIKKLTDFPQFKDYVAHLSVKNGAQNSRFQEALQGVSQGEFQRADLILEQLRGESIDNIWVNYAYAENLQNLNRWQEAERIYEKLLELYPGNFVLSLQFGRLKANGGKYSQALSVMKKLEQNYPEEKEIHTELVKLYKKLNNPVLQMLAEGNFHWFNDNKDRAILIYVKLLEQNLLPLVDEISVKDKLAKANEVGG